MTCTFCGGYAKTGHSVTCHRAWVDLTDEPKAVQVDELYMSNSMVDDVDTWDIDRGYDVTAESRKLIHQNSPVTVGVFTPEDIEFLKRGHIVLERSEAMHG